MSFASRGARTQETRSGVRTVGALRQGRVIKSGAPCATQDLKMEGYPCQQLILTNIYDRWWVAGAGGERWWAVVGGGWRRVMVGGGWWRVVVGGGGWWWVQVQAHKYIIK